MLRSVIYENKQKRTGETASPLDFQVEKFI